MHGGDTTWQQTSRTLTSATAAQADDEDRERMLLGELMERSISAPPPAGSFDFEGGGGFLGGGAGGGGSRRDGGGGGVGGSGLGTSSRMETLLRGSKSQYQTASDDFLIGSESLFGNTTDSGRAKFAASSDFLASVGRGAAAASVPLSSSSSSPSLQQFGAADGGTTGLGGGGGQQRATDYDLGGRGGGGGMGNIGSGIVRPKSAAPEYSTGTTGSSRAPPGLGGTGGSSGGGSLLFETSRGGERTSIMEAGAHRSASTGVTIRAGGVASSSVMSSLGLMQQSSSGAGGGAGSAGGGSGAGGGGTASLMDLIKEGVQEDLYRSNNRAESPEYQEQQRRQDMQQAQQQQQQQQQQPQNQNQRQHQQGGNRNDESDGLYKQMQNLNVGGGGGEYGQNKSPPGRYAPRNDNSGGGGMQSDNGGGGLRYVPVSHSNHDAGIQYSPQQQPQQHPIYAHETGHGGGHHQQHHHMDMQHQHTLNRAPLSPHGHHPHIVHHQHQHQPLPPDQHQRSQYEAQTIYYSTQQQMQQQAGGGGSPTFDASVQTQTVLHTTPQGHAVYLNAPPPPPHAGPYGYATIQYHTGPPPPPPPHGGGQRGHTGYHPGYPPQEQQQQHISVVPINAMPGSNGSYAYWPQPPPPGAPMDGHGHGGGGGHMHHHPQTVTVMNAHGQPTTIAVAGAPPPSSSSSPPGSRGMRGKGFGGGGGGGMGGKMAKQRGGGGRRAGGPNGGGASSPHHGGVSSTLLEDFRASKNRTWTISDIKGHVVEFCQDQNGSRFIQQRLEVAGSAEKDLVMSEIIPSVRRLCNDVFGNYVIQKLLELGTPEMRVEVMKNALVGEMISLSMQMYGCRVVQKALETLDEEHLPGLLSEFEGNVLPCIHDQNGNHVMQKCVEVMNSKSKAARASGDADMSAFLTDKVQFIIDDVLESIAPLSCHPYGCRVLQRILEHCMEPQKSRVLDELSLNHKVLLDDQYGNYVIQHVLQFGRVSDRQSLLNIILDTGLLSMSRQKFASNVVEKLLKFGTPGQRNAIVGAMLEKVPDESSNSTDAAGTPVVILMVRDAYANYVVQTALDVAPEGEERRMLIEVLNANVAQLRNYTFAKHIVAKISSLS